MKTQRLLALTVLSLAIRAFLLGQDRPAVAQGTGPPSAQNVVSSWYPIQPGDTWVYQKEFRTGVSISHPIVERWTTEETIVSAATIPEIAGILVTKRTKVLRHAVSPGFIAADDSTKRELSESHVLIHQNCLYVLDGIDEQGAAFVHVESPEALTALDQNNHLRPQYRDDLLRGNVPADFCFPLVVGMTWGRIPDNEDWIWAVKGLNADPFGEKSGTTFHLWTHVASGEDIDRWFELGVGVLQEIDYHHAGTHDEGRRTLLKTVIGGKPHRYQLTPARMVVWSSPECHDGGWRRFARADGSSFTSQTACVSYFPGK